METVILGLGSNKGDCAAILQGALNKLHSVLHNMRVSSLYKTKPQDYLLQDDFFNLAVAGEYHGSAHDLLITILAIEAAFGRDRQYEIPKGPRYLDIDIIFFGSEHIHTPDLQIPHLAYKNRCFVLVPMLELFPDYIDPVTKEVLKDTLAALPDQGVLYAGSIWNNEIECAAAQQPPITQPLIKEALP